MAEPANTGEFLDLVGKSGLLDAQSLDGYIRNLRKQSAMPTAPAAVANAMVRDGVLTSFQAEQLLLGKWRNFFITSKYKILERLGSGGMATVYLCEHTVMRRRVALKVLPDNKAEDPASVERFHREARAVAQLHHPNIVAAHDVDFDGKLHFLVMEHVDGASLQELVKKSGQMDVTRASHYIRQAAVGLQHAHEAGLVHRDVKPANLIVDRGGTVKVLDLGLARFFHDQADDLTNRYDEGVIGTADYLAPEQVLDSHSVDIRADIYSLGVTFYFLLTAHVPFREGTVTQKLIWHQIRTPKPILEVRPDVPADLVAIIDKMMAKDPAKRYQTPAEVIEALVPWTQAPVPPPSDAEMPPPSRFGAQGGATMGPARPDPSGAIRVGPGQPSGLVLSPSHAAVDLGSGNLGSAVQMATPPPMSTSFEPASRVPAPRGMPRGRRTWWLVGAGAAAAAAAAAIVMFVPGFGRLGTFLGTGGTEPTHALSRPTAPSSATALSKRPVEPPVTIARTADQGFRVKTPSYEADIGNDGNVTSVRVGGVEFLKSGVVFGGNVSRGSYFYDGTKGRESVIPLGNMQRTSLTVVAAESERAAARYEFEADRVRWKLTNRTDQSMPFYMVLDHAVTVVSNGQGEWARVPFPANAAKPQDPAMKPWTTTVCYAGAAKATLTGGTSTWGPWPEPTGDHYQVWDAILKPGTREQEIVLQVGQVSPEEARRVAQTMGVKPAAPAAGVTITAENSGRKVRTAGYEAIIDADGCMTSLRVAGVEFLYSGGEISRGIYFHLPGDKVPATMKTGRLSLPDVKEAGNAIIAKGSGASVRYEFTPDAITCHAADATASGTSFFVVFDPGVLVVKDARGEFDKAPVHQHQGTFKQAFDQPRWAMSTWYAGGSQLTLTGGMKIWGPWEEKLQVWETDLDPGQKLTVVLTPKITAAAEADAVFKAVGVKLPAPAAQPAPPAASNLTVHAPLDYQVFQRHSLKMGAVAVRGQVGVDCDRVEARITGHSLEGQLKGDWQAVALDRDKRTFAATLPTGAGGWYEVTVRALKGTQEVARATATHVGVGEVFVGAGQSNSTNCGQERIKQESGMVSSFGGSGWQPADDPQPGVHDHSTNGSFWPAFGDALYEKYRVPIGVASTGHGGSKVKEWEPGGELFNWMLKRMNQLGPDGFRGVLWHQGEADVGMPPEEYVRRMTALIEASRKDAGWKLPWFVAQVSYQNPGAPMSPGLRAAQKKLWTSGVALEGPDTDQLTGDNRDMAGKGIHFSVKGLRAHGKLWAENVGAYIDASKE